MKLTNKGLAMCAVSVITVGFASVALAQASLSLRVNGRTVSNDVRIIDGHPYVPLSDMARAMGGSAVKHHGGGGYEIRMGDGDTSTPDADSSTPTAAGGANEVRGTRGNIGQMLFNGKWRFSVLSVDRASSYNSTFLADSQNFSPNGDNEDLVLVRCRLKNGQKDTQSAMLSAIHPHNIAVTDNDGQAYSPLAFDKRGGSTDEGPKMIPGSATEFVAIFSVPKSAVIKELVFSLQTAYSDTPDGGTDVRISLAP